jgi:predicted phage-related endonuclease
VSLDRKINKTKVHGEGSLELKTIGGFEMSKWEFDIPPKYVSQVTTQMLVCKFLFGELALFQDGRRFDVLPFSINDNICQQIVTQTKDFWTRVEEGKKFVAEKYVAIAQYNQRRVDECNHEIDKLAPEPDGSLAYAEFMKDKFLNPKFNERPGTQDELSWARQAISLKNQVEGLKRDAQLYENRLKSSMKDHEILDFSQDGRVYWMKAKDESRRFSNKVKTAVEV